MERSLPNIVYVCTSLDTATHLSVLLVYVQPPLMCAVSLVMTARVRVALDWSFRILVAVVLGLLGLIGHLDLGNSLVIGCLLHRGSYIR